MMSFKKAITAAFLLGAAGCTSDSPVADFPVQYQFSTDRSLADRGKIWKYSAPEDFKVTTVDTEPHAFKGATIRYLHPDKHHEINRIFDERIELTLVDGSQCGFDMNTVHHYVEACTGPQGHFTGMLRTLGRLVDGEFVPVSAELGWGTDDLTPSE